MDPFSYAEPFNFGPSVHANRSVKELLEQVFSHWAGTWKDESDPNSPMRLIDCTFKLIRLIINLVGPLGGTLTRQLSEPFVGIAMFTRA